MDNNHGGIKVAKTDAGFRTVPIPSLILPVLRETKAPDAVAYTEV